MWRSFNPRTSYEVRPYSSIIIKYQCCFNPRTSYEVRPLAQFFCIVYKCFNPSTSYEVRLLKIDENGDIHLFQSTHLIRGATVFLSFQSTHPKFQSTHLIRGATSNQSGSPSREQFQSTHLIRGATEIDRYLISVGDVSIHAPHTRCDIIVLKLIIFMTSFNPRTSYEVRLYHIQSLITIQMFQSTHLIRGATTDKELDTSTEGVSIHAPHTRCDSFFLQPVLSLLGFNPRTSYEVRRGCLLICGFN